jgi:hypothetical protein
MTMRAFCRSGAGLVGLVALLAGWAGAQPELRIHPDGTTHYYYGVAAPGGITWDAAFDSARARGGFLATLTSQADNDMVFPLVSDTSFWATWPGSGRLVGPWLGGYQRAGSSEPDMGWFWTTGEPFDYGAWSPDRPDNRGGSENALGFGDAGSVPVSTWNDLGDTCVSPRGFVTELSADSTTIGLFQYDSGTSPGYVLYSHRLSRNAYLIDNKGRQVHKWVNPTYGMVAQYYLTEDGKFLHIDNLMNPRFWDGGRVAMLDWDGNEVWGYNYSDTTKCLHHDAMMMPNGNVLFLAYEYKSGATAIAAGRNPSKLADNRLSPDHIVEVNPANDSIVWEWHAWDHLVQDFDSTKTNYGDVAAHPELIDLNFTIDNTHDWLHCDGLNYNAELDQILISVQRFAEVWVIDHSTTTAEASGHAGGRQGMGGDLLYRWGNPQTYRAGTNADRKFYGSVHAGNWIKPGLPGAGHILAFNGGAGRPGGDGSSVDEFIPACDSAGSYARPVPGTPFGPAGLYWTYIGNPPSKFNGPNMGGAQRLPNGNTLTAEATKGRFYEVTPAGTYTWRYMCPETDSGVQFQGDTIKHGPVGWESSSFRSVRYLPDYPGLVGRELTPGLPVERYRSPLPRPAPLAPANRGVARTLTPTLRVGVAPNYNCDSFRFRLFDHGGTTPIQTLVSTSDTWMVAALPLGRYDWDAQARSGGRWSRFFTPRWEFTTSSAPSGWSSIQPMPLGIENKSIKAGGWLTYDVSSARIYASKGNKTSGFYRYNPTSDSWYTLASWPPGTEGKPPAGGSAGCNDGSGVIYATKGNNKLGFYTYDAGRDSWCQKTDVPLGVTRKRVKGGTDIVWAHNGATGSPYLLKGYKNEFYRYDVATGAWQTLTPAPVGLNQKWDKGSWLAYDDAHGKIYAFKAKYHEFYRYSLDGDSWSGALVAMPIPGSGGSKKSKDGGCGTFVNGSIYALKGGNTQEFWKYAIAGNSWAELETIPRIAPTGLKKKKVKTGADIISAGSVLYATKGNSSLEFWRYGLPLLVNPRPAGSGVMSGVEYDSRQFSLRIAPNPFTSSATVSYSLPRAGAVSLKLFDVTGSLVTTFASGRANAGSHTYRVDATKLARGVYLVKFEADGYRATKKLILE